jgi:hypothetical protein
MKGSREGAVIDMVRGKRSATRWRLTRTNKVAAARS